MVTTRLLNFDTRSTIIKQSSTGPDFLGGDPREVAGEGGSYSVNLENLNFPERGGGENRPLYTTHVATRLDIPVLFFYT